MSKAAAQRDAKKNGASTRDLCGATDPVLVIGGAGFIGSNLAARYLSEGVPVRILDNLSRPGVEQNLAWLKREFEGLEVLLGDVRDRAIVRQAVMGASAVYHFAAQVAVTTSMRDPLFDEEVNVRGTLHVLEAVRAHNPRTPLLFTSTNKVYGGLEDLPLDPTSTRYEPRDPKVRSHGIAEDRPLELLSPYGCSKGAADQYVLDYARHFGVRAAVFRMSCIYGPRQFGTEDQGWLAHFLLRAMRREPITIYGDGRQVRDALFVDDLVDLFVQARAQIDCLAGRAFNVGGGPRNSVSLLELLELIGEISGAAPEVRFAEWRPGDQRYFATNHGALTSALGWAPTVAIPQGVRRLQGWLANVEAPLSQARPAATKQEVAHG